MAAIIFTEKILGTRSSNSHLLCRLGVICIMDPVWRAVHNISKNPENLVKKLHHFSQSYDFLGFLLFKILFSCLLYSFHVCKQRILPPDTLSDTGKSRLATGISSTAISFFLALAKRIMGKQGFLILLTFTMNSWRWRDKRLCPQKGAVRRNSNNLLKNKIISQRNRKACFPILWNLTSKYGFGPDKLPRLSTNGTLVWNRTWATSVRGERSHHCSIPIPTPWW